MQTEEKQDQPTAETAEVPRHLHFVSHFEDKGPSTLVLHDGVAETVRAVYMILHSFYGRSKKDLARVGKEFADDASRVGRAYLRAANLSELEGVFDSSLLEHPLFEAPANLDCLEEAFETALLQLDTIEVAEDLTVKVFFCDDQCEELTKAQAEDKRDGKHSCPGCGTDHNGLTPADLVRGMKEGLEGVMAEAGFRITRQSEAERSEDMTTE